MNRRAFTLVELLVVSGLVIILADLLPLGWDPLRGTAADRRRMTAA